MSGYEEMIKEYMMERANKINATLVGRAFSLSDDKEVEEFIDWYIEMADRLGVRLQARETHV